MLFLFQCHFSVKLWLEWEAWGCTAPVKTDDTSKKCWFFTGIISTNMML